MRTMENLPLANFLELQLKTKEGFAAAIDISLGSGLKQCLKKFVVVQPGDWPCQFYCRQLIYDQLPIPNNRTRNQHLKAIYVIITMYLNQQVQQS